MNLLLDTHTLIWFLEGDTTLSTNAKNLIENPANTNFVSVATFWEMAIKVSLKKLEMQISIQNLKKLLWENGIEVLPITIENTLFVSQLPFHHKDPFDRLLIAQAVNENMMLVSKDEAMLLYNVQTVW
ncbi:MAG: type II toxin-antitoxin system VapC family toxin [Methylococcaceae bacterium]|nr:type II toxin-antitoxin system VapC family toxin [Methylococcaceae bacterium]